MIRDYDNIKPPKPRKTQDHPDISKYKQFQQNSSKMTKVLRFLKKPVAILIGTITSGGSLFTGLDVEFALLLGVSAFLLVAGVEMETIKELKELMQDEEN